MKRRIVRKHHPYCGNWWVIQKRVLFFWITSKLVFDSFAQAKKWEDSDVLWSEKTCDIIEKEWETEMTHKDCKGCTMLKLGFWCNIDRMPIWFIHCFPRGTDIPTGCPYKKYKEERK